MFTTAVDNFQALDYMDYNNAAHFRGSAHPGGQAPGFIASAHILWTRLCASASPPAQALDSIALIPAAQVFSATGLIRLTDGNLLCDHVEIRTLASIAPGIECDSYPGPLDQLRLPRRSIRTSGRRAGPCLDGAFCTSSVDKFVRNIRIACPTT